MKQIDWKKMYYDLKKKHDLLVKHNKNLVRLNAHYRKRISKTLGIRER